MRIVRRDCFRYLELAEAFPGAIRTVHHGIRIRVILPRALPRRVLNVFQASHSFVHLHCALLLLVHLERKEKIMILRSYILLVTLKSPQEKRVTHRLLLRPRRGTRTFQEVVLAQLLLVVLQTSALAAFPGFAAAAATAVAGGGGIRPGFDLTPVLLSSSHRLVTADELQQRFRQIVVGIVVLHVARRGIRRRHRVDAAATTRRFGLAIPATTRSRGYTVRDDLHVAGRLGLLVLFAVAADELLDQLQLKLPAVIDDRVRGLEAADVVDRQLGYHVIAQLIFHMLLQRILVVCRTRCLAVGLRRGGRRRGSLEVAEVLRRDLRQRIFVLIRIHIAIDTDA